VTHRVLVPRRFAERLSAEARAELERLQSGLAAIAVEQAPAEPQPEPLQRTADLAQWYLVIASQEGGTTVWIDADACHAKLLDAAGHGYVPTKEGVAECQRQWSETALWPLFHGEADPPFLR